MALEQRTYLGELGGHEVTVTLYEDGERIHQWEFEIDGVATNYQELAKRFGQRIIRSFIREAGLHAR
jgi:hypothetical protein